MKIYAKKIGNVYRRISWVEYHKVSVMTVACCVLAVALVVIPIVLG